MAEDRTKGTEADVGHVYLVGAGPGSRGLMTVRGLELLQRCDVLVYDRLCGEELPGEARPGCERIYAGKKAGDHGLGQAQINRLLVEKARAGMMVVRLKGGDAFVFGRGGEEAECLLAAGIPFSIVPGVTSAVAAPEMAGIPVTHRALSRSFHVITAQPSEREPEKVRAYLRGQIEGLRDAEGTFVFLMGLSSIDMICGLLLECGRPPGLAVAVVSSGSRYNEVCVRGTLADIGARAREAHLVSPAVIVVGEVAGLCLRSPAALPLQGRRIGMVGTEHFTKKLGAMLREAGAETLVAVSLIPRPLAGQDAYFTQLATYTWIVFTSSYGVEFFLGQLRERKLDVRSLAGAKMAVIGAGTAQALAQYGIFPSYMPQTYTARALAAGLAQRMEKGRDRVLLYQAREGNPVLEETLRECGVEVVRARAYATEPEGACARETLETLSYLTFASGQGVAAFCESYPGFFREAERGKVRIAAIGSETARALCKAGCRDPLVASVFTARGLAEAIVDEEKEKPGGKRAGKDR